MADKINSSVRVVNIANHEFPGIWDNVYYFKLSGYPDISDWELRKIILFSDYEKRHGRKITVTCENSGIIQAVNHALANPELYLSTPKPDIITECTACRQKGCLTDYLCHTSSIEDAKSIFKCGKIYIKGVFTLQSPFSTLLQEYFFGRSP